jgi:hypothetical protein
MHKGVLSYELWLLIGFTMAAPARRADDRLQRS